MGRIQDAILRVQRTRKASVLHAMHAGDVEPMPETDGESAASDQDADVCSWDYGGCEIAIDSEKLIDARLLDPDHLRKHLSNEYRQLKKMLLANITSDSESEEVRRNLIMVGSAEHGEGKSFISLNLAMSLASEPGHTVVLIDSDTDNPRISELLCTADASGFTDLLADPSLDVMQVISPTDMPGLSILTAGKTRGQAGEIAGSDHVAEMFDNLAAADPRRIFIFDSAPVHSTTGSRAVAEHVGQVLLVVQSGKTPQQSVLEVLEMLGDKQPISIVLNQVVD